MTAAQLSVAFFLQMAIVLATCRLVGFVGRRLGQPQVVGEMVAGVLLGPSLFGWLLPDLHARLFPPESLQILYVGAQLGVGLYMFLVGVEFKTELLRSRLGSALGVSLSGMVVPCALGSGLAVAFVRMPGLFAERTTTAEAMLFLSAAMSITAFPVLARIIQERGLTGTRLGTLALAAGCIDDAAAWCVLAVVLASFGAGAVPAAATILGGAGYMLLMLTLGRRALRGLETGARRAGGVTPTALAVILILFTLAGWLTDTIGLHTVFGGFLLGVAMPRGVLSRELTRQLEPFAVVFLLPMFFTYSGLNTRLDLVTEPTLLAVAIAVLAAACLGKGVACWGAARWQGESQRTALAIGALMNTRGMMELIAVNIGLQHGIIRPPLFSVLVLMAVVTTLMTSPLFAWIYGRDAAGVAASDAARSEA
jgi:Kef-type K+ transport system membrane component KefB